MGLQARLTPYLFGLAVLVLDPTSLPVAGLKLLGFAPEAAGASILLSCAGGVKVRLPSGP